MDYLNELEKSFLYIEENLENKIERIDVAGAAGYSYFHFQRLFEAIVGQTVGSYIRSRRLTKAAEELIYTDKRILDIALNFQFESQAAFTRAFKSYFKNTPHEYRKNRINKLIGKRQSLAPTDLRHLYKHLTIEPEIIEVNAFKVGGLRFTTTMTNNQIPQMWTKFNKELIYLKDKEQLNHYTFFEMTADSKCMLLEEQAIMNVFIGVSIDSLKNTSKEMEKKIFIGGKYAKFIHKGSIQTIYQTYNYIWGTWIPFCKYEVDCRDDFECCTSKLVGENEEECEVEIYIPIK